MMSLAIARLVATLVEGYLAAGVVFALAFLPRGIVRVDPLVGHSPVTVRMLLAPGVILLWPAMAILWGRALARADAARVSANEEPRP
jgi:hypothetical protein